MKKKIDNTNDDIGVFGKSVMFVLKIFLYIAMAPLLGVYVFLWCCKKLSKAFGYLSRLLDIKDNEGNDYL